MLHENEEPDRPDTCGCDNPECANKALLEHRVRTMEDEAGERYVNVTDVCVLMGHIFVAHATKIQQVPVPMDLLPRIEGMLEGMQTFGDFISSYLHSNVTHISATIEVPDSIPAEWLTGGAT